MHSRIMFIENKSAGDGLTGPARIGRVRLSRTGRTLYYRDAELQSLKGMGYKANYLDINTGDYYWVSGPKKNGQDTLYPDRIEIDEDVREEYWVSIRGLADQVSTTIIRSEGKHTGWRYLEYQNQGRSS